MSDTSQATHDAAISGLCKTLINGFIKDSKEKHGDTDLDRLKNAIRYDGNEAMWDGITALSSYLSARAATRQAEALESIARTVASQARSQAANTDAQALVDDRQPQRDHLATTYSLPSKQLSLLWAMRGMLMDAAVASLSRPNAFEVYERISTEDLAWSLRITPADLLNDLPRTSDDAIDFRLMEAFGIFHYGGTDTAPDDWMYGG